MKLYGHVAGWLLLLAGFLALDTASYTPMVHWPAVDTVTYGDLRIVYKLAADTGRTVPSAELTCIPEVLDTAGARGYFRVKSPLPSGTCDSVLFITGDTLDMSPLDSATAATVASNWGYGDPYDITLAWHDTTTAPDPLTGVNLAAVYDTGRVSWDATSDSVRIFWGLDAGGDEDTDYVAGNSSPYDWIAQTIPGDHYTCANAYTTQAAGDYADNRCDAATFDTVTGGGTSYTANEPAGYTQVSERIFSAKVEDGWTDPVSSPRYTIQEDLTAPTSPDSVGRCEYPVASWIDGSSPCGHQDRIISDTDSLYIAFTLKLSSNFYGHDNSGVNKIVFITANDYGGGGDPVYVSAQGSGDNTISLQVRLQGPGTEESQSLGSPNLTGNISSATITRGSWYEIEMLLISNTGTNYDGEVHVWMNGTKTHEYTDVKFFDDSADTSIHQFDLVKWTAVYGGVGGSTPQNGTQYTYMDNFYISAR